jgi:outer membrane protein assembly factor BamB
MAYGREKDGRPRKTHAHSRRGARLLLPALALSVVSCADPSVVSEWPMYSHDAGHTNTNLEESAIRASNVGSLGAAWQAYIGFEGAGSNSTPTVMGGTVYVGSSVPSGPNFFAFSAATGASRWTKDLGHVFDPSCGPDVVGIPSTAAVSGSVVVIGGGDSAYYGLDTAAGRVLWRHPMGDGPSGYAWSSPLIHDGAVYFGLSSECDNPSVRGEVRAVNLTTGALVTQQFFAPPGAHGGGVWNSPALAPDNQTLVVVTGEDRGDNYPYEQAFVTLDATTLGLLQGDKEGQIDMDVDFGTSPVIFHDHTGRLMGMAGSKDASFYAYYLDSVSSGPAWTRGFGVGVGVTPAYDSSLGPTGTLFAVGVEPFSGVTQVHALDPETGKHVWAAPTTVPTANNNIAVAGRLIFVNAGEGGLVILDETTGTLLRTVLPAHAGPAVSGVAVAEGTVFWVSGAYLNAWRPISAGS